MTSQRLGQSVNIRDRGIHALHEKAALQVLPLFPRMRIEITLSFGVVENNIRIKRLDELHIPLSNFRAGVHAILGQHSVEGPALDFAETGDDAARSMPALIAVQVERVIGRVEDEQEGFAERVPGRVDVAVLVGRNVDAHAGDGRAAEPGGIVLRGLGCDEGSRVVMISMESRKKGAVKWRRMIYRIVRIFKPSRNSRLRSCGNALRKRAPGLTAP